MKRALSLALLLAVALITSTPASQESENNSETSKEYSHYNYMETSGNLTLMVYSFPAHWRAKEKAIPLWITIGMGPGGDGQPLVFGLANFVLFDSAGNSYPAIPAAELWDIYKEQMSDQNLMVQRPPSYGLYFKNYGQMTGGLYPAARNMRLSGTAIELNPQTYYGGMFYFPQPKAGPGGVLTVRMQGGTIETPIEVKFRIPE